MQKGEATLLQSLLARRFGALPDAVHARPGNAQLSNSKAERSKSLTQSPWTKSSMGIEHRTSATLLRSALWQWQWQWR